MADDTTKPGVGILMGSISDWETMEHAALKLDDFSVPYLLKLSMNFFSFKSHLTELSRRNGL